MDSDQMPCAREHLAADMCRPFCFLSFCFVTSHHMCRILKIILLKFLLLVPWFFGSLFICFGSAAYVDISGGKDLLLVQCLCSHASN
uniref:Uncharacterized protein n=1 Tax=Arundo donax TaxID=35708 RepID=A0A0A8Z352_ARUDO